MAGSTPLDELRRILAGGMRRGAGGHAIDAMWRDDHRHHVDLLVWSLPDDELEQFNSEVGGPASEGMPVAIALERAVRDRVFNRDVRAEEERTMVEHRARVARMRREPTAEEIARFRAAEAQGRAIDAALAAGSDTFKRAYDAVIESEGGGAA